MKRFFSTLLAFALTLSLASGIAYGANTNYSDLSESGWAREAILSAGEYGLMGGMGDGTFGVGRSMTRAEKLAPMAVTSRMRYSGPMIRAVARNSCFNSFLSI